MQIKHFFKRIALVLGVAAMAVVSIGGGLAWATAPADVTVKPEREEKCATILYVFCESAENNGEQTIKDLIKFIISVISIGIGVLATIGIIICAYMIMTAKNNDAQVAKAKTRLLEIVIGVVVWAVGAGVILLLVPDEEAANFAEDAAVINMEIKE